MTVSALFRLPWVWFLSCGPELQVVVSLTLTVSDDFAGDVILLY